MEPEIMFIAVAGILGVGVVVGIVWFLIQVIGGK